MDSFDLLTGDSRFLTLPDSKMRRMFDFTIERCNTTYGRLLHSEDPVSVSEVVCVVSVLVLLVENATKGF